MESAKDKDKGTLCQKKVKNPEEKEEKMKSQIRTKKEQSEWE